MTGKIRAAMQECANHSTSDPGTLLALMDDDPQGFLLASVSLIQDEPGVPGRGHLLKLLATTDEVIDYVCDPVFFSLEESAGLTALLAAVEPHLDTKLAKRLLCAYGNIGRPSNQGAMDRVLALLDGIPASPRTAPALASLLGDPNPRLRATLAKLVGRCMQNTSFAEQKQQESDPRVRANAIESLWGDKTTSATSVLWRASKDGHNRVVGNALLGLYRLQDPNAIPSILTMSADSSPQFRASAAWVMGQTGDPRFLPALEKLARDLYAPVRKNASKAVTLVQQSMPAGSLELRMVRTPEQPGDYRSLWLQVLASDGAAVRGLLPSQFVLWSGKTLVTDYGVVGQDPSVYQSVAFALCRPGAESALAGLLARKPPEHSWAVAKFYPLSEEQSWRMGPIGMLTDSLALATELAKAPFPPKTCPYGKLLPLFDQTGSGRHLVFFTEREFAPEIEPAIAESVKQGMTIHAIVDRDPSDSLNKICERSGGMLVRLKEAAEVGAVLGILYSGLSNRYCVRYRTDPATLSRIEVYSKDGRGGIGL